MKLKLQECVNIPVKIRLITKNKLLVETLINILLYQNLKRCQNQENIRNFLSHFFINL